MDLKSCKDSLAEHEKLCKVNEKYDKNKVPGSLPLTLTPVFDIRQVAEVNIIDGSIAVFIYLTVLWEDQNVAYKPNQTHQK